MPTCPGCRRTLPHNRLPVHFDRCTRLNDHGLPMSVVESFEGQLRHLEQRFETRLAALEATLEDRPGKVETTDRR